MKNFGKYISAVISLAVNDFKQIYSGSALGALWALAEPLVTVAVYWFVYSVAFGGQSIDGAPYYLWLSAGISAWFFISDGISSVTACYRDYAFLVKKTRFDKARLPLVRTVSVLIRHFIFLTLAVILAVAENSIVNFAVLLTAVMICSLFVYSSGKILALLCVVFKDVKNIVSVLINIGFWLTPVFWSINSIPPSVAAIERFNPAAALVGLYRSALLGTDSPTAGTILYLAAVCMILLLVGGLCEKKILPCAADRL